MNLRYHRLSLRSLCVWLTIAVAVTDAIGLATTNVDFDWKSAVPGCLVAVGLLAYAAFYTYVRPSERISKLAFDAAVLILFSQVGCVYGYLIATSEYPLQDKLLAEVDQLLGFDWIAYNEMVFSSFPLRMVSLVFYNVTLPLVVFTMVWFCLTGNTQRSAEFVLSIILGALLCITLSWFLPAAGAVGYYAPGNALYNGMIRYVDLEFKQDYFDLRDQVKFVISMKEPKGLVAFPSYHVCMAVLTIFAFRDKKFWLIAMLAIGTMTLLSTPVDGGHHLIDSLAGGLFGVLSFLLVKQLNRWLTPRQNYSSRE